MSLRHLIGGSAILALLALAGCDTDPYCLTCVEGDGGDGDAAVADAAADAMLADRFMPDAGPPPDGGVPDGCLAYEICNEMDDDCDGEVDEDFDTSVDVEHCGGCDNFCGPPHAFPVCTDGVCGIDSCDVGFYDLDGDLSNGCEYRCAGTDTEDSVCDLRDNDCDGEVDEDVDFDGDEANCGICGRVCGFAHSTATCESGVCELGACDAGFHDIDGRKVNGCEYACTPKDPPTETCNLEDDDCDGTIDEGDPGGGVACGISTGECAEGTTTCVGGTIQCSGAVEPTTELCNGLDDDCDGTDDEGNPEGGRLCGSRTGTCEQGREQCSGGSLVCMGAVGPTTEICDGLDNDCDGTIDEGNPDGGADCGIDTGECSFGTETCVGGGLVCMGGTGPTAELCNGLDDDCDGTADEDNPEGGGLCGTDVGTCVPGVYQCNSGTLECIGATGPATEVCDGLDNNCDGSVDEGNPGGGASCGSTTGECTAGTETCTGGTIMCVGVGGPSLEICNTLDDDCDGSTDEDFDLTSSVVNCGSCGNTCSLTAAIPTCISGVCQIASCESGFHDLDGDPTNGCEYACTARTSAGSEVCNGLDDDCDGAIDEPSDLSPPANFCNPNGVCAGTTASCVSGAWTCEYPAATYEPSEFSCDDLDNDCDGATDEFFTDPAVGDGCNNGRDGVCFRTGTYECNTAGDGVVCNAPFGPAAGTEICDGLDNDCDGTIDNGMTPSVVPTVPVPRTGGGTVYVMAFEASRPDATSSSAGTIATHACADNNVLPWTTVTWTEARDACCAMNDSGTCSGDGSGWRLCDSSDWEVACEGGDSCTWSYGATATCSTSQPTTCNGKEYDCNSSTSGDEDCLFTTGSPTFPACYADWDAAGTIYDMSGNVREWTNTSPAAGIYELRGGSFNTIEAGRRCQFDFTVAQSTFSHPSTGFRCCYY